MIEVNRKIDNAGYIFIEANPVPGNQRVFRNVGGFLQQCSIVDYAAHGYDRVRWYGTQLSLRDLKQC